MNVPTQRVAPSAPTLQGDLSNIKLVYLEKAYAPLQVTTPSKNNYTVYGGVEFSVAEQDIAWFLARRNERGKPLYQAIVPPAPAIEPEPLPSFAVTDGELTIETVDEATVTTPKRKRKATEVVTIE